MAYVSEENLKTCGKEITLIARTNTAVAAAATAELDEGFYFNKDAGRLQCPTGKLAMRVEKREAKNGNRYYNYVFSKIKCRKCSIKNQRRVGKGALQNYGITQLNEINRERLKFEASGRFN